MQTKTLSNLVLEFPALEKSKGKALKGGSTPGYWDTRTGLWHEFGWYNGGQSTMLPGVTVTPGSHYPAGGTSPYPNNPNNGGNSGGGNSGGGGSGGGWTDHYLNQSHLPPAGSPTNFKNACVFDSAEILDHYYGGNKDFLAFAIDYKGLSNLTTTLANGFQSTTGSFVSELNSYLNNYFNTNVIGGPDFTLGKAALDREHPIIATLWNDAAKTDGHEVIIVGYSDSGTYRYYDSQTGLYSDRGADDFDGLIEITGKK